MQTQIEEFSDFIKYESQFGLRVVLKDLIEINRLYFRKRYIQNIIHFADKEKFRFTFFVRSFDIEKKVGLLKKLKKSGHEIASHGHTHVLYENKSHNWLYKELNKSKRVFQKYNFQIKGFRSPFLSENKYLSDVLEKLEFNYVSNKFFNINENNNNNNKLISDFISWPSDWHGLIVNKMSINEIILEWKNNPGTINLHPWIFFKYYYNIKELIGEQKDLRIISNLNKKKYKITFDLY